MGVEQYSLVAHDWLNLEFIINDLASRVIGQELGTGASPTWAGTTWTGKLDGGSQASPIDVTNTRKYGLEFHYSGNDYDVTGIRSRAQLVTTDTIATAQGALLQVANNDGINAGVLQGALIEAIGKSTSNAATISTMRGALIGTEWGALDTVTNLKTLHVRGHSLNAAGAGSFGTGYGIYIENEAVGGNGQAYDAGIYFKGTNLSAGNKAFTYGIDFSGATYTTAIQKWPTGVIVCDGILTFTITDTDKYIRVDKDGGSIPTIHAETALTLSNTSVVADDVQLSLIAGASGESAIFFGDTDDEDAGRIDFLHSSDIMRLSVSGGDFVEITSNNLSAGSITSVRTIDCRGILIVGPTDGGGTTIQCRDNGGTIRSIFDYGADGSNHLEFKTGTTSGARDIFFTTEGVERFRIKANGNIGVSESAPETKVEITDTAPYLTFHNSTHEDSDGGGESRLIHKREDGAGTETACFQFEASHNGSGANDQLGKGVWSVNTGSGLVEGFRLDSNAEVTFAQVATGVLPTAGDHLCTKEYTDLAIGASFDLFLSDTDDGVVANTHVMYPMETGEAESTEDSPSLSDGDNQLALSWLSEAGIPGTSTIRQGVYDCHIHLNKNSGGATTTVYWKLSYVDADGSSGKILICTSETSGVITTSELGYNLHATVADEIPLGATKRLLFELYANISVGQNVTLTATLEGEHDSHISFQLPSSIWQIHGNVLDDLNTLGQSTADGEFLVATGAGAFAYESGATARASMGALAATGFTSKCSVYRNATQAISTSTWTKVQLNTEDYDIDGEFDSTTNYRFQPDVNGYYNVKVAAAIVDIADRNFMNVFIYKNGSLWKGTTVYTSHVTGSSLRLSFSCDIYLETTDYIELWVYHDHGSNRNIEGIGRYTFMDVHRIG